MMLGAAHGTGCVHGLANQKMKRITIPLTVSVLLLLVYGAIQLLEPPLLGPSVAKYVRAALLLGLSVGIVRAISFVLFDVVFQKRKGREAPALLRVLLSIILYSVCLVLIYKVVLQEAGGGLELIATSTVVSVIIGLALQDTLGNFFAGLSIHIEQPFHILDAIRIGHMIGRVEAVTWRTTTIRTNDNTTVIFPNSTVAKESLEVYRFNNLNRRVLRIPAPYHVAPQRVIPLIRETVASIPNVASERTPIARIGDFADSSIIYEVLYWTKDYMWVPDIDAQIRQHVWYIYRRSEIDIPFPVRHVLLEQQGQAVTQQEDGYEKVIGSVEIFAPLSAEEKEAVARSAIKSVFAPGELILRRGAPGDSMFVIYRGNVEVQLPNRDGHAQQVAELKPGSFFGEMALLTGEPRNADVVAVSEVETLEITKGILQQLLDNNTELAEGLSHMIAERQTRLDEYARVVPDQEKHVTRNAILRRIQRFFGLD
jgi:small-conductance mechanosensitive channel/CRP-like cAMP-binding protein